MEYSKVIFSKKIKYQISDRVSVIPFPSKSPPKTFLSFEFDVSEGKRNVIFLPSMKYLDFTHLRHQFFLSEANGFSFLPFHAT